jgi:ketosteroid isomerase-like protein
VPLVAWWQTRNRKWLYALGGVAALAILFVVLALVIETPQRQIARKIDEMAAAVKARDVERIFAHVSSEFRFRDKDREAFKSYARTALDSGWIDEVAVWDIELGPLEDERTRPVTFRAKPKGGRYGTEVPYFVKAVFTRDPDGQWRMKTFDIYNPVNIKEPIYIPNVP